MLEKYILLFALYILTILASALYLVKKYEKSKKKNMDKPEFTSFTQIPTETLENEGIESKELITSAITNQNYPEIY
jgi:uncharacterized SAM-binding protein YcdF (DUF218 family)